MCSKRYTYSTSSYLFYHKIDANRKPWKKK